MPDKRTSPWSMWVAFILYLLMVIICGFAIWTGTGCCHQSLRLQRQDGTMPLREEPLEG